ncbi:MAG TPA: hypothetical protein VI299_15010, partial [Polyangiales bacterium]
LTLAFDAEDAPAVSFDDLAAVPGEAWPTLRFALHPSVHLLALRSNAAAFRMATDSGSALPGVTLSESPVTWLVWRHELAVSFRSLSDAECSALVTVRDGGDFSALCEALCEWFDVEETAARAAGFLRQWVEDGLIAGTCS